MICICFYNFCNESIVVFPTNLHNISKIYNGCFPVFLRVFFTVVKHKGTRFAGDFIFYNLALR